VERRGTLISILKKAPVPDKSVRDIYEITPEFLWQQGITLLLMDLDNTLSPYSVDIAGENLQAWIESMKKAGIEPFLFSNNKGDRPEIFAKQLDIDFVKLARKPRQGMLRRVLAEKDVPPERTALIGDQIYTDVLCANLGGLYSIVVRPIKLENPLHTLRYGAEFPFRMLGRWHR